MTANEVMGLVMQVAASAVTSFQEYPNSSPSTEMVKSEAWTALESAIRDLCESHARLEGELADRDAKLFGQSEVIFELQETERRLEAELAEFKAAIKKVEQVKMDSNFPCLFCNYYTSHTSACLVRKTLDTSLSST